MFSAISLLVLACAITINAQAPPAQCSSAQIGKVPTTHAVKLSPATLQPSVTDFIVTIPYVQECLYGVSGVQVFMCDVDVAPTGYFTDFSQLMVHRNGALQGVGTVTVTVFCVA